MEGREQGQDWKCDIIKSVFTKVIKYTVNYGDIPLYVHEVCVSHLVGFKTFVRAYNSQQTLLL